MKEAIEHNYQDKDGKCLFPEHFNIWIKPQWKGMPAYFQRLNSIKDDRSFVVLAASVLEMRVELFLSFVFPNPKAVIDDRTGFARKIDLVRAFNYIPTHFIEIADLLRLLRNDFAHDYSIDSFDDPNKKKKMQKRVEKMTELWELYSTDMIYWESGKPLRLQYKDLWRVCIEGFKVYQLNVELFRKETEQPEYIEKLMNLSDQLRQKREIEGRRSVFRKRS